MKIHPDCIGIQLLQAGIQLFGLESNFSPSWIPGIQLSNLSENTALLLSHVGPPPCIETCVKSVVWLKYLTFYQTTKFYTCLNSKDMQTTK